MLLLYRAFIAAFAAMLLLTCGACGLADTIRVKLDFAAVTFDPAHQVSVSGSSRRSVRQVSIPGFNSFVSSGNPALPCKLVYIALPPDADESSVKVMPGSYSTEELPGFFDISPVPPAASSSVMAEWGVGKKIVNGRNADVYCGSEYYPREHVRLLRVGWLRAWKVAVLEFWPYAYNPASGKLRRVSSEEAVISFDSGGARQADYTDPAAVGMSEMLANREDALGWYAVAPASAPIASYVIITTNAIASASTGLVNFVNHQVRRGFTVKIATETDWGGGTGDVAAEHIRAWLVNNYLNLGIQYVLLIGNPNPASGEVPMKMLWPRHNYSSYKEAPSDYYYSDLTSNWDLDKDGYPGEEQDDFGTGGIDGIPEVYVGRIPYYGSVADMDSILRKTIDYESDNPADWARTCLLSMMPLDTDTQAYQLGEDIRRDLLIPLGIAPNRVYNSNYGLSPSPENYPCSYTAVTQAWMKGGGLHFWMSHGSSTLASNVFGSSWCSYLDDTKPTIVYMASCSNGQPEDTSNLGYSVLRRGGVTTLSASRVSWYFIGETDFTGSDSIGGIGYQYAKYLISRHEPCGRAAMDARLVNGIAIWPNHLVFNLYGDPSLVYNQPPPGAVSGKVLGLDRAAIAGATIATADGTRAVQSQADGSYYLGQLQDGSQDILVTANGYYSRRFYGVPVLHASVTHLDVSLARASAASVCGYVLDAGGKAIANALVELTGMGRSVYTDSNGAFSFSGVTGDRCTLTVTKAPYIQEVVPDVLLASGAAVQVNVTLQMVTGDLLVNGGFENGFESQVGVGWQAYSTAGYTSQPMPGVDYSKYGSCSQKIRMPQPASAVHAGFLQTISVTPGCGYRLVCWGRNYFSGQEQTTADNIVCRLGYDTTGGTDYSSAAVRWLNYPTTHDAWNSLTLDITPSLSKLTVFLDAWRKLASGGDECYAWFDGASLTGPMSAPSVPVVTANCSYQNDTTSVSARWTCVSGAIARYDCAISRTADASGIVAGGDWAGVGANTSVLRTGLALGNGDSVRVLVRAVGTNGVTGEIGASGVVRIISDAIDVSAAKQIGDGTWVRIADARVSRMGDGPECFVQDVERVAGICARGGWSTMASVPPGTRTALVGCLSTENGMRVLTNAEMMPSVVDAPLRPLGMSSRQLEKLNYGLLVTVWGRVAAIDSSGFTLYDGGELQITCHGAVSKPALGTFVRVTGISEPGGLVIYGEGDILVIN